jgi:enoyl-CoA hydratase/carnithine racemase
MDMVRMAALRIAAETARFTMSYVNVGIVPGDGGCYYLPRIVGVARALDLIWTDRTMDAEEALQIGYGSQVVPARLTYRCCDDLYEKIGQRPTSRHCAGKTLGL